MSFDLSGVGLKEVTRGGATVATACCCMGWSRSGAVPVQFHLFTDGSAQAERGRSGYSVAVLLQIGIVWALAGVIAGPLGPSTGFLWPESVQEALRAEQVALAVAVLWTLQFAPVLQHAPCHIHYDCLVAGRASTGDWKAPDPFNAKIHHLELFARLRLHHVKAHCGHAWNELADEIAKAVSRGQAKFFEPPTEVCETFLSVDWSWLAAEAHAVLHGSLLFAAVNCSGRRIPSSSRASARLRPNSWCPRTGRRGVRSGRPLSLSRLRL